MYVCVYVCVCMRECIKERKQYFIFFAPSQSDPKHIVNGFTRKFVPAQLVACDPKRDVQLGVGRVQHDAILCVQWHGRHTNLLLCGSRAGRETEYSPPLCPHRHLVFVQDMRTCGVWRRVMATPRGENL